MIGGAFPTTGIATSHQFEQVMAYYWVTTAQE